jgi:cation-transporting P-type ATPase 13A2
MVKVHRFIGSQDEVEDKRIDSGLLVPGDIISIPYGEIMPCDAIVIKGACVMNEAILTGESIPAIKQAISEGSKEIYDPKKDSRHTLFGGTKVL